MTTGLQPRGVIGWHCLLPIATLVPVGLPSCTGVFAMGSLWMPCANERALHDPLRKARE